MVALKPRALPRLRAPSGTAAALCLLSLCAAGPVTAQDAPLTLSASISQALAHNAQARAAGFTRSAAKVDADRSRPGLHPAIEAVASQTVQAPRLTLPGLPDSPILRNQFGRLQLTVEQTIYHAGQSSAVARYNGLSQAADQDYLREISDVEVAVAKSYTNVQRADAGVAAAEDGLRSAERYRQVVIQRVAAGRAKPVDTDTADAQVAEAQAGVSRARGAANLARLNFNRTLGRPLQTDVRLAPESNGSPSAATGSDAGASPAPAIAQALATRADLRLLQANLAVAHAGIGLARSQSSPVLSLRGEIDQQTPTVLLPSTYAAATLELRWRPFDYTHDLDVRQARAQEQRLAALLDQAREGIALEVTQSWQRIGEAKDRIRLALIQQHGAESVALAAETAYEVGRGSAVEVEGAQREVRSARDRVVQAQFDLIDASADFRHAQGILDVPLESLPR